MVAIACKFTSVPFTFFSADISDSGGSRCHNSGNSDNVLERGVRAKVEHVFKEVEDLGLPPVKNGANFRAALIHLGNELVKNELVSLSKKAGLSKQDVYSLTSYSL